LEKTAGIVGLSLATPWVVAGYALEKSVESNYRTYSPLNNSPFLCAFIVREPRFLKAVQ